MRSLFLIASAVMAVFVLPAERATASHYREILIASRQYAEDADLFHRSLGRCRRATDYAERLAQRLACAAGDLHAAIRAGDSPQRVAFLYDEVYVLHDRVSELLGSRCSRPDPIVLAFWRPMDASFERLVCAIEGCHVVCPLISHRRQLDRHQLDRHQLAPFIDPHNPLHDRGRRDDFGRDWGQVDRGRPDWGQRDLNQRHRNRFDSRFDTRQPAGNFGPGNFGPGNFGPGNFGPAGSWGRASSPDNSRSLVVESILSRLLN